MSYTVCVLVLLLSLKVSGRPILLLSEDEFGSEESSQKMNMERKERLVRSIGESNIVSEEDEYGWTSEELNKLSESDSQNTKEKSDRDQSSSNYPVLEKAMENEANNNPGLEEIKNKEKRQICNQIMDQLKNLPCDHPMMITCGGPDGETYYPCGDPSSSSQSPLRAVLSDVDNILNPDTSIETAFSEPRPLTLPQISPIQTLPVFSSLGGNPLASLQQNSLFQRPLLPGRQLLAGRPSVLQPSRILTEAERRERQKGIFEGLLRFGTVVNHVDSFLTDKGKMIVKGLHRMVESEEDSRFN